MFAVYSDEMREIDKRAIEEYKIPGIILMENAARAVFNHVEEKKLKNIVIVCGRGNNGGDGFALARMLHLTGYNVEVFCFSNLDNISGDAGINLNILINMDIKINENIEMFKKEVRNCDIIVDAIFGTGLNRKITGLYNEIIEIINNSSKYIIAIDIPSGINSDSGEEMGICILSDETITFECFKIGHLLSKGRRASGKVYVEHILIPEACIKKQNILQNTNFMEFPLSILKKRENDTNKGNYGKLYIFGGSYLMSGAVILASKAALRTGSGLVTCVIPENILDRVGSNVIEATYMAYRDENGEYYLSNKEMDLILERADVIALGIGLGKTEKIKNNILYMLEKSEKPIVIDADGINLLSTAKEKLRYAGADIVITPHPGEMARLTGLSVEYINANRVNVAKEFAKSYKCIVLLKGSSTVVTDGERVYVNTSGNPGMASGGSGDALTGIIASLIGQGYDLYESTVLGAYIHGAAGDEAYKKFGYGLVAGDIIDFIGNYIN